MKIAIDCRMLGSGGIGSYIQALLPFFIKNNECLLIGKENALVPYKDANVQLIYTEISPFSVKDTFCFPKNILEKINECNIFYTPYCNIPNGIKIPVYSTIHDVVFLDIPDLAGFIGTLGRKFFYKRAIRKSKKIFTVSNFSKDRIIHHLKPKKKNVIVTYNALPQWFETNSNNCKKENYILFVGNIKKHKGLHTLLEAYKICNSNGLNFKLLIVGNADNFRTSDNTISKEIENLNQNIEFTGKVSDEELKEIYSKARLLIQPSLYEGFGMPPLEALSLGTNVVLSDIPVFKEIYENLPVTFFKTEDSDDLAKKIISSLALPNPKIQNNPYSFERTYSIIIKELEK